MQTEVGMTGVVWPNILLIHWIYCVGVASSIRKVALRLSLNGKKESNLNKKKSLSFLLLLLLSPSFPQWFFFFWNACLECNTSVCLSSYVYRVERKENDAHRRCHRLKYTGSAQQLFSLPPPLSLLLPLSFFFSAFSSLVCCTFVSILKSDLDCCSTQDGKHSNNLSYDSIVFCHNFNRCMYLYKEL